MGFGQHPLIFDLLVWWLKNNKHVSQVVVKNGDLPW